MADGLFIRRSYSTNQAPGLLGLPEELIVDMLERKRCRAAPKRHGAAGVKETFVERHRRARPISIEPPAVHKLCGSTDVAAGGLRGPS